MHACHFYRDRDELIAALVPYFVAGLQGNERCLWITAPPLPAREAVQALRAAWDGVDDAIRAGALRIIDFDRWYAGSTGSNGTDVVQLWLDEEERALAAGYNGLRVTGNLSFLEPGDWSAFMAYEEAVTARFNGRRIVALCSYAVPQCDDQHMSEVMHAHHCALEHPDADWRLAAVSEVFAEQLHDERSGAVMLVVDDNPDICEVIVSSFAETDFRIECAYSAEEALRRLASDRIDLALIDLLMPGRPGVEVAKRFAAGGAAVIVMSGALDAEERLVGTGFKLLRKPFRLKTLVETVHDSIGSRVST
jgi:CheY-like chemotaxis protein